MKKINFGILALITSFLFLSFVIGYKLGQRDGFNECKKQVIEILKENNKNNGKRTKN